GRDCRLDLWNESRRRRSADVDQHARGVAEPASIRRPGVGAHRLTPSDHVVKAPSGGVLGFENHPTVDGEDALPAARTPGENEKSRPPVGVCRRQHADARPIGVAEARGTVLADIERRINREGKEKDDENSEEHFSNAVHGEPAGGRKYGVCHRRSATAMRHSGTLKRGKETWLGGPAVIDGPVAGAVSAQPRAQSARWPHPPARGHRVSVSRAADRSAPDAPWAHG